MIGAAHSNGVGIRSNQSDGAELAVRIQVGERHKQFQTLVDFHKCKYAL
jgi:hypothetical protein